jgi:hypothetical protein
MGQVFARFLSEPPARAKKGKTVVYISDTHGLHRDVVLPTGHILVHAGDFTRCGNVYDSIDFNDWLGELPHRHKIVVFGNHEQGSTRGKRFKTSMLTPLHTQGARPGCSPTR